MDKNISALIYHITWFKSQ